MPGRTCSLTCCAEQQAQEPTEPSEPEEAAEEKQGENQETELLIYPPQAVQQQSWTPPPHKVYKGTAGSPTSFPVRPPGQRPGQPLDPDDDDHEWVKVGPNHQIPSPEQGPLEKRVSTSFLEGMITDKVNLQETDWWFTEPPGDSLSQAVLQLSGFCWLACT